MRFNIISDTDWESRVDKTLAELAKLGYFEHFSERDYGAGLIGVTVVFMCQDPDLNSKRRLRMSKKERKLYMDIMLDLPVMKAADAAQRRKIIAERLRQEVPQVLSKYQLADFDRTRFNADLAAWIASTDWL